MRYECALAAAHPRPNGKADLNYALVTLWQTLNQPFKLGNPRTQLRRISVRFAGLA